MDLPRAGLDQSNHLVCRCPREHRNVLYAVYDPSDGTVPLG